MGRTKAKTKAPNKPISEGFKMWCAADEGFFLEWLFHDGQKGHGPLGIQRNWTDSKGYKINPTQALVLELVTRLPNEGKGTHIWLDNLFTNAPLLEELYLRGIGASGTVRTNATGLDKRLNTLKEDQVISKWSDLLGTLNPAYNNLFASIAAAIFTGPRQTDR